MQPEDISTREAILLAAIDSIEKQGLDQVTTRLIAERAGANVAAINYYFRSKDRLIEEALATTLRHMLEDVYLTLEDTVRPFREVFHDVIFYLLEGAARWPGITTAHLHSIFVAKAYDSPTGQAFLEVFEGLHHRAGEAFPSASSHHLQLLLSDVFSAVIVTMLAPGYFGLGQAYEAKDEASCRRVAAHYTELFCACVNQVGSAGG